MIDLIFREYDLTTGRPIGFVDTLSFSTSPRASGGNIRIIDISAIGASLIDSLRIRLTSVSGAAVLKAPSGSSLSLRGNFGIQFSDTIVSVDRLSSFFSGVGSEVSIPLRSNNVSQYIYLSADPGNYSGVMQFVYGISITYSNAVRLSSSSSSSSSS